MKWNNDLCSNNDFETTCISLWTPCLAFAFNKQKFNTLEGQVGVHWCAPALAYCGSNLIGSFLLLTYTGCALNSANIIASPDVLQIIASLGGSLGTACYCGHFRKQLREKYNIDGNIKGDICTHFFCSPCALCQETAELKYQNDLINNVADFTKAPFIQVMTDA